MLLSRVPICGILMIPVSSIPSYLTGKCSSMRIKSKGSMKFLVFCTDYLVVFILVENNFSWFFVGSWFSNNVECLQQFFKPFQM
ncbi:hypothetical protein GLYMA_19G123000v4 [Glycine max]|uniref:Uncharacterized protein n=1 Tax=Glycine max TaxID=3847 RepID=K7MY08_SOYBN|nr:hypothetical protein JHK85_054192 [Glycine max]KAH1077498.1 hypothetical protein GYH30_052838 [Glycine max]KRG94992.1 hypothetical protein GLYMA_19G123000v4 [Glycine max]